MASLELVESIVRAFVARVKPEAAELGLETSLYAEGVGLDSLETAELSAVLEDEFVDDPFMQDDMPQTLGDILAYYGAVAAEA